ncbi:MAG: DNA polymerase I [Candidatus Niyogibacteria bacterium CG10_big_fil_rev_8_21_14_0_10_42_19]|uniref:DNA-directed DNA polymerase n=1 Tax=Candidatus Niyogibacteria bacterium CG10_big_fil_rev_8_21_14_0_10_42_19 TaxID=1974725 RepID=A0A2H0TGL1_9BACT|nr:MAG: DNA polymerase I [Candidatus Niyogibacteria bacterium CG10_big_fil_rev_8_21_14_0_10_42_19]
MAKPISKIKKEKSKTLVLLDAHAILHRAFHALPQFVSPAGEPTGAIYGFSVMLLKIIRDIKPDYIAAAYDLKAPTFRHLIYDKYKSHRKEVDRALAPQFEGSREILKAFDIPAYDKETYEADDIIGTLVEHLKKEKNLNIVIASGDLDALQLVKGKKVRVYTLRKGIEDTVFYDEKKVIERYGFGPELVTDYKGLKGDPSDNIPGVAGIGEKTACDLIINFGRVEKILETAKKAPNKMLKAGIKERIIRILGEKSEDALFSKELASIKKNVPISFSLEEMYWQNFDKNDVAVSFKRFGFFSLVKRIPDNEPKRIETSTIKTLDLFSSEANDLIKTSPVIFWSVFEDVLYAVTSGGVVVACDKKDIPTQKEELKKIFLGKTNCAFHIKQIWHFLCPFGIKPVFEDDLKIMFWVLNPHRTDPSFEMMVSVVLSTDASAPGSFSKMPEIFNKLLSDISEKNLKEVYRDIEMPLVGVLFDMENAGVLIDVKKLEILEKKYTKEIRGIEKKIHEFAGEIFNVNSPKELSRVLFEKMQLPIKGIKKTETGWRSTRFSELFKLKNTHPIIDNILKYREFAKLLSTYIEVLPKLADGNNKIHTTFNQTGTVTGRMSSSEPNVQQIPNRGDLGGEIREAFRAQKDRVFFACDYSQIQLRIAAYLSKDKKMLSIFKEGKDIHTATAAGVFNVKEDEVTSKMRRHAKVINFGILYGMGVNSLAENLGVSKEEARNFLKEYFDNFSGLAYFFEQVKMDARLKGYVETIFGRKRYLPEIVSAYQETRREAERMAINAPIQGSEADIIKLAMIKIGEFLKNDPRLNKKIKLILQIHDELLFEADKDAILDAREAFKPILENICGDKMTLPVEFKAGPDWGGLKSF